MKTAKSRIRHWIENNGHELFHAWELAQRFGVSHTYVVKIIKAMREEGWNTTATEAGSKYAGWIVTKGK